MSMLQPVKLRRCLALRARLAITCTVLFVPLDGTGTGILTHTIVPASASLVPGVYNVELNAVSANGAWKITTGAGVEVMALGIFTA